MANWVWLNIPLGALIFLAVVGIPLWLVVKRPDTGPAVAGNRRAPVRANRISYRAADPAQAGAASAASRPEMAWRQRLSPVTETAGGRGNGRASR